MLTQDQLVEVIKLWEKMMRNERLRVGQALFNALDQLFPIIANTVRGNPDIDPFYNDDNLEKLLLFLVTKNA